ncbi:MAG: hypothetical protein ABI639_06210 [Thermoanaerobaculia bacterium]
MRMGRSDSASLTGLLILLFVGTSPVLGQQIYRLGIPQLLIPTDGGADYGEQIICSSGGSFLAAWISQSSPTTVQVVARIFAANGLPTSDEIAVTPPNESIEEPPSLARDAAGNFVVVWWDPLAEGPSNAGVRVRMFSSAGVGGTEFPANSYTAGSQRRPSIAMRQNGDFVVVWAGEGPGAVTGIWKREFNSAGVALGVESLVETGVNDAPLVGMHPTNDSYVIAWNRNDGDLDVRARRYDAAGAPLAAAFDVNTSTSGNQGITGISVDADGDFVILFSGEGQGDVTGILGQLYGANGTPVSPEFWVNAVVNGEAYGAVAAFLPSGEFLVAWSIRNPDGRGFAARFSSTGFRVGATDFPVTQTLGADRNQDVWAVCADGAYTYRIALAERPSSGFNEEFLSQRLSTGLFADGFESSDMTAWSASVLTRSRVELRSEPQSTR